MSSISKVEVIPTKQSKESVRDYVKTLTLPLLLLLATMLGFERTVNEKVSELTEEVKNNLAESIVARIQPQDLPGIQEQLREFNNEG